MQSVQDPAIVRERIDQNLAELGDLHGSERSRSRKDILAELSGDLAEYYGYLPELTELFLNLFSPAECLQFMEANDRPRPLVIRTNTLKTSRKELMEALTKRGAHVEPVDWSKVAIKVTESPVPIGATPEYLAGHYILQSASSLNPVMALDAQVQEKILDMASAPGGKTSYIAQLMKNTGMLIANDISSQRQKATIGNLHRLGVKNTIVCHQDGRKLLSTYHGGGFDRILLDAPCSGLGIISRDPSVKVTRTVKDIARNAHLQKELVRQAIDLLRVGGTFVYSTCSIAVEENEQVVQYLLDHRYVKLVDTGLLVGKPGLTRYQERRFHPTVSLTRRFYPHVHNMDGFYVAKFMKYEMGERKEVNKEDREDREMTADDDEDEGEEEEEGTTDEEEEGGEKVIQKRQELFVKVQEITKGKEKDKKQEKEKKQVVTAEPAAESKITTNKNKGSNVIATTAATVATTSSSTIPTVAVVAKESKKKSTTATTTLGKRQVEQEEVDEEEEDEEDEEEPASKRSKCSRVAYLRQQNAGKIRESLLKVKRGGVRSISLLRKVLAIEKEAEIFSTETKEK